MDNGPAFELFDPALTAQPITGGTTSELGWRTLPLLVEPRCATIEKESST